MQSYYCPIIGTLGYVLSPNQKQVLLVHRNKRKEDDHFGKYNGLGGKMHRRETVSGCMQREIKEEAGIDCLNMVLKGTINWTDFGKKNEDWLGFIFLIDQFSGDVFSENEEGSLEWIDIDKVYDLPLWEGDRYFLDDVFSNATKPFHGFMPYDGEKPVSWLKE